MLALKVENLSKQYRLGQIGTGTLSHDLNRLWARVRGKEDPYAKIGATNDRTQKAASDYVWALKDINFEIEQGDAVGIIGRNGAGKSTLLKILSRTTLPTTGSVKVKGRIASLLEVGTGFHPEMTGRENIYQNGALLGMTRSEIKRKFDEIVDFSGCEAYIDTPVKRYSSGMYVRLAFAVAAHLESEILIVDEVLAVGDAEFQKKCLGKMNDVSKGEGRTVIFVSHDINSILSLTDKSILLKNGNLIQYEKSLIVTNEYIKNIKQDSKIINLNLNNNPHITSVDLVTSEKGNIHFFGKPLLIKLNLNIPYIVDTIEFSFQICNIESFEPIVYNWFSTSEHLKNIKNNKGKFEVEILIDNLKLYKGNYFFKFYLSDPRGKTVHHFIDNIAHFEIQMNNIFNEWGWQNNVCKYIENCKIKISEL